MNVCIDIKLIIYSNYDHTVKCLFCKHFRMEFKKKKIYFVRAMQFVNSDNNKIRLKLRFFIGLIYLQSVNANV